MTERSSLEARPNECTSQSDQRILIRSWPVVDGWPTVWNGLWLADVVALADSSKSA